MSELVGVVLGAGSSKRLGRPKQTLAFGGRTLLAHVMADVEASALSRVVLVLGGATLTLNWIDPVRRRVDKLADKPRSENDWLTRAANSVGPLGAFVLPADDLERNKMMEKMHQAGYRTTAALQTFYLIKTVLILILPLFIMSLGRFIPDLSLIHI